MSFEILMEVLIETLTDGIKMLPLLYLAYLLIEWLETHQGERIEAALASGGKGGFIPGAALGLIPQCGFSVAASNLYASRVITPGTLLAVFIATSDEAIPILAADPSLWKTLVLMLVMKFIFAMAAGFLLDYILKPLLPKALYGGYSGHAKDIDCHEEHEESHSIFVTAARHTLEIMAFILLFSFIIGLVMEQIGAETVSGFMQGLGLLQPVVTALIGLIPNCTASVLLSQLYIQGAIRFGSLFSGLCSGAGVGLAVLWRVNQNNKQNLLLTVMLWAVSSIAGMILFYLVI